MFISLIQFFGELLDLSLELLGGFFAWIVVDYWPVGDEGGLSGVCERGDVLFDEGIVWIDAGNHEAVAIPSDRLLQDRCQLRIPIGHIHLFLFLQLGIGILGEDVDDLPERKKRLVDIYTFLGQLAFSACHGEPF